MIKGTATLIEGTYEPHYQIVMMTDIYLINNIDASEVCLLI
jgi:hypothetical protein